MYNIFRVDNIISNIIYIYIGFYLPDSFSRLHRLLPRLQARVENRLNGSEEKWRKEVKRKSMFIFSETLQQRIPT